MVKKTAKERIDTSRKKLLIDQEALRAAQYDFNKVRKFHKARYQKAFKDGDEILCPYCGSREIDYSLQNRLFFEDSLLKIESICDACNSSWFDHFKFHHTSDEDC